jgi:hypothetical protein
MTGMKTGRELPVCRVKRAMVQKCSEASPSRKEGLCPSLLEAQGRRGSSRDDGVVVSDFQIQVYVEGCCHTI